MRFGINLRSDLAKLDDSDCGPLRETYADIRPQRPRCATRHIRLSRMAEGEARHLHAPSLDVQA